MSGQGQTSNSPVPEAAQLFDARLIAFNEPCPYLKDRTATLHGFFASRVTPEFYRRLLDVGFRRSGRFFYHTGCRACGECVPLRIPVNLFKADKSQRRCWKRNQDLQVTVGTPELTEEKFGLYCRYLQAKHADSTEKEMGALRDFLYNPVVESVEFCYRNAQGELLAVGICDVFGDALSSVYCYYNPVERRRGLGTFAALREIDFARNSGLAYYYLGFLVNGCRAMAYKASYRPYELLCPDRGWVRPEMQSSGDDAI